MENNRLIVIIAPDAEFDTPTRFEAVFSFELEGIVKDYENPHDVKNDIKEEFKGTTFESLVEGLTPEQRIIFSFAKLSTVGKRAQYVWRITGRVEGDSEVSARKSANTLWESVFLMLLAQHQYRFRPVADPLVDNSMDWWGEVLPRSVDVSCRSGHDRSIGFNSGQPEETAKPQLLLPILDPEPSEELPIATILSAWPLDMEVQVELRVLPLTDQRRDTIEKLSEAFVNHDAEVHFFPDGEEMEDPVIDKSLPDWKYMLDYCLAHQNAVVVTVRAGATTVLPPAMLATIGRALFPYYSFEPEIDDGKKEPQSGTDAFTDLRNLIFTDRNLLPSLLPDVRNIEEIDLPKSYAPPPADIASSGLVLGSMLGQPVCQTEKDRLRHTYIIGATGTGKSTLIYNMIMQDINAGKGVCLIDPHGDLYADVLRNIPKSRHNKNGEIVLINPGDFGTSVGLNFLECVGAFPEVEQSILINEFIRMLDILYDLKVTGGPIFEQYMRNALLLLLNNSEQNYTLIDVPRVFEDKGFRNYLKENCTNPHVLSFWNDQAEKAGGEASLANMVPYITSKFNQFSQNPVLRPIFGQSKSTIDFRRLMDEEKILLVNLSKGVLSGLDSYLLGMVIIGKLFRAALSRVDVPLEDRKTWHVYIDEFQNFMTETVSDILSEARKFGLSLVLANQHMDQLNDSRVRKNVMNAVLGNVGNLLFFRLGVNDAEKLENYTSPHLSAEDLQFLPDHHAVARILNNLSPAKPFVFKTHAKPDDADTDPSEWLISLNALQNAKTTEDANNEIMQRQTAWKKAHERKADVTELKEQS